MKDSYSYHLCQPCDPEKIISLSKVVFKEGHLDKLDDLLIAILPLAHIVYYKHIKYLDDGEYAKEDLISDAILRLYQDMSLRWDKYIRIESYYEYFSTILRNGMIGLVHEYHNFYLTDEINPEATNYDGTMQDAYEDVEIAMLKESINQEIKNTTERILRCRRVNTNLLLNIFRYKYIDKVELDSLRSRVRVLGVTPTLFNFYCEHVDYVYKLAYNYQYAILGGKTKMINRISDTINRFEDVTYKMLSTTYYDSIIPEIYAEFGADVAKKFVRTFSGRTVQVPEYRDFCDDLLGGLVLSLADGDKSNLYRVAEEYHMSYKTLSRIYNRAQRYEQD